MHGHRFQAMALMADFLARTGVTSAAPSQRYLWTDAFALNNLLALSRETGDSRHAECAEKLITAVHRTLGRHRSDDPRSGWLSGLSEEEGARHPTRGGLRIGKPLPERGMDEPPDETLEWSRDGQYFHYLTKWMEALASAAEALAQPRYRRFAAELAEAVLPRFLLRSPSGEPLGLAWKLSIDLSRAQVPGMNPQDALDGYATLRELEADGARLSEPLQSLRALVSAQPWQSTDLLGIGGLLMDALRLLRLPDRSDFDEDTAIAALAAAERGLRRALHADPFSLPPSQRLGFRELGLAIGLQGVPGMVLLAARVPGIRASLDVLQRHLPLGQRLVQYWLAPERRDTPTWREHGDINEVMLASALLEAMSTARPAP